MDDDAPDSFKGDELVDNTPATTSVLYTVVVVWIGPIFGKLFGKHRLQEADSADGFKGWVVGLIGFGTGHRVVLWCVRDDGALLSLTFFPEQEVIGWARHDTQGKYESVVCITEDNQDVVYFIVNRPGIGRCIERMAPRQFQDQIDAYFVDCGLTYDGRATNTLAATFTGLDHLEGQTVSILADGMVYPQQVVLNGSVTIPNESLVAHMGLPYTSDFETLEISSAKADLRDKKKAINSVSLIVDKSGTFQAGPDVDHLERPKIRSTEDYNAPDNLLSEIVDVSIPSMWNKAGRIFVRQSDPLPLTILTCIPQVSVGGY